MRKLKIGLFPFSSNLQHPGDRRRVVSWAQSRGHELRLYEHKNVDLICISERANFSALSKIKSVPKIFDLIDGYLATKPTKGDFLRGVSKSIFIQNKSLPKKFSHMVADSVSNVDLVICSSIEQKDTIEPFNRNVSIILDNHEEFPLLPFKGSKNIEFKKLFWEGTTHTLGALKILLNSINNEDLIIKIVTDKKHKVIFDRYFEKDVIKFLKKSLTNQKFEFDPWSITNVTSAAKQSDLAVLPVEMWDGLQYMKPENRLLIMFRLGMPSVTSGIPAYQRIERELGIGFTCANFAEWEILIKKYLADQDLAEWQVKQGQKYISEMHTQEILFEKWDKAIWSLL